jgi:hypothetical protein
MMDNATGHEFITRLVSLQKISKNLSEVNSVRIIATTILSTDAKFFRPLKTILRLES